MNEMFFKKGGRPIYMEDFAAIAENTELYENILRTKGIQQCVLSGCNIVVNSYDKNGMPTKVTVTDGYVWLEDRIRRVYEASFSSMDNIIILSKDINSQKIKYNNGTTDFMYTSHMAYATNDTTSADKVHISICESLGRQFNYSARFYNYYDYADDIARFFSKTVDVAILSISKTQLPTLNASFVADGTIPQCKTINIPDAITVSTSEDGSIALNAGNYIVFCCQYDNTNDYKGTKYIVYNADTRLYVCVINEAEGDTLPISFQKAFGRISASKDNDGLMSKDYAAIVEGMKDLDPETLSQLVTLLKSGGKIGGDLSIEGVASIKENLAINNDKCKITYNETTGRIEVTKNSGNGSFEKGGIEVSQANVDDVNIKVDGKSTSLSSWMEGINGVTSIDPDNNLGTKQQIVYGSIIMFAGNNDIDGYIECNGNQLLKDQYPKLYSAIGDQFNTCYKPDGSQWSAPGDGYFRVPDLRARFIVGKNDSTGDYDNVGKSGGKDKVSLTESQLPAHAHDIPEITAGWTMNIPLSDDDGGFQNKETGCATSEAWNYAKNKKRGTDHMGSDDDVHYDNYSHTFGLDIKDKKTEKTGSGEAHENRPPFYVMRYLIRADK